MSNSSCLYIVDYSEKAIALFGDTKPYKTKIMEIGGKYNARLKSGENETKPGFIFSKSKRSVVESLINQVANGEVVGENIEEHKVYDNRKTSSSDNLKTKVEYEVSKQDFMNLVSKVERLEQEISHLKSLINKETKNVKSKNNKIELEEKTPCSDEDDEEEEDVKPSKMKRNYK